MPHYRTLDPKRDSSTRISFTELSPVHHAEETFRSDAGFNKVQTAKPFKTIPKALQAVHKASKISASMSMRSSSH